VDRRKSLGTMIPQAYGTEFYLSYMASVAIYTNLEPCFHSLEQNGSMCLHSANTLLLRSA
jgi:hypothetical protein